jgi:putative oxidoreductase
MPTALSPDAQLASLGLLAIRVILGLLLIGHGAQKLFGWFGGHGLAATGGFFDQLGFRPGRLFAGMAAGSEVISGLLIALGVLGPVGPALLISVMIVAAISVHWQHGIFATSNGIELPMIYGVMGVTLALTGPGRYSVDSAFGLTTLWTPEIIFGAIMVGVIGGVANLIVRRAPSPTHQL